MPEMTQCPKRQIPAMTSIANQETLTNLIYYRERVEISSMKELVSKKMFEEGKSYYDVWMYEVSDEIQSFASAFGERFMLENALSDFAKVKHAGARETLERVIFLHSVNLVRRNVAWYLVNEVISHGAAAELDAVHDAAVKALVPHMNTCVEALGLTNIK